MNLNYIKKLPLEMLIQIILNLSIKDIIIFINLDKYLKLLLDTSKTWEYIFKQKFLKLELKNIFLKYNQNYLFEYKTENIDYKNEIKKILQIRQNINEFIKILLMNNSNEIYIFGGALRDNILNKNPKDIDLLIIGNRRISYCLSMLKLYFDKRFSIIYGLIIKKSKINNYYLKNSKHIYKIDILTNNHYPIISIDVINRKKLKTNDWDYDVNTLILSYENGWKYNTIINNANSKYIINIIQNINNKIAYENPNENNISDKRKNKMIEKGFTIKKDKNYINMLTNNKLKLFND